MWRSKIVHSWQHTNPIMRVFVLSGKKLFSIMCPTSFLEFIWVLILIFVYLMIKKLKKNFQDIKQNIYVVVITFFQQHWCPLAEWAGYGYNLIKKFSDAINGFRLFNPGNSCDFPVCRVFLLYFFFGVEK